MEGGTITEISPRTLALRGGFGHVFRVTFTDNEGQEACVYLNRWQPGEGPEVGDRLEWQEGETYVSDFVTDGRGFTHRKFGEAFDKTEDVY